MRLEKEVEVQRIRSEHEIRTTELNRQNEGNGDSMEIKEVMAKITEAGQ